MSAHAQGTSSAPAYLGFYPVGAFLVESKQAIGPLVTRLRAQGRLKSGVNVTPFQTSTLALCAPTPREVPDEPLHNGDAAPLLASFCLTLREAGERHEEESYHSHHRVTVAAAAAQSLRNRLQPTSPQSSSFFAVHATGAWSEGELVELLAPARVSGAPAGLTQTSSGHASPEGNSTALAYVHQLRVFSSACRTDQLCEATATRTPAAQAFHNLMSCTTKQRQGGEAADDRGPDDGFTFSELFGGIGLFRVGLERAGGRAVFGAELAAAARTVYEANFPHSSPTSLVPLAADLTELPSAWLPSHDVLTAGFPCQSFAKAGPAKGLRNTTGWLFYEVVRVLLASRPRAFLLENVANLVEVEEGAQLSEILRCLRSPSRTKVAEEEGVLLKAAPELSYSVGYRVLDGAVVTPQTRRRVYFIGLRVETDALSPTASRGEQGSDTERALIDAVFDAAEVRMAAIGRDQPFRCVRDVLEPQDTAQRGTTPPSPNPLALTDTQWEAVQRSPSFRQNPRWRLANLDGAARTLLGSYRTSYQLYSEFVPYPDELQDLPADEFAERVMASSQAVRPDDVGERSCPRGNALHFADSPSAALRRPPLRFFSVRECARLQGIPDSYHFPIADDVDPKTRAGVLPSGAMYKLIGNAVNPLVIECLGRSIAESMSSQLRHSPSSDAFSVPCVRSQT